jgi:Holliday junction resolvasome RuvABC endonuclease subunit
MKVILAIDPGTHCGWAVRSMSGALVSGEWDLRGGRFEGGGMRFIHLRKYLLNVLDAVKPDLVAYEEVRRHMSTDAAHCYGGIIAHIQQICEEQGVPYLGIPVGTIKKHATGKGSSDKLALVAAANIRWPDKKYSLKDNNEVDARWIAETAAKETICD